MRRLVFLLVAYLVVTTVPALARKCVGDDPCAACTNCSRCGHCAAGGTCGACASHTTRTPSQAPHPRYTTPPVEEIPRPTPKPASKPAAAAPKPRPRATTAPVKISEGVSKGRVSVVMPSTKDLYVTEGASIWHYKLDSSSRCDLSNLKKGYLVQIAWRTAGGGARTVRSLMVLDTSVPTAKPKSKPSSSSSPSTWR